jgi:putative transposase
LDTDLNRRQLRRVLTEYLRHYNAVRPHRSLDLKQPRPASRLTLVEPDSIVSPVQRVDVLGGLIHEYHRRLSLLTMRWPRYRVPTSSSRRRDRPRLG